MSTFSGKRDTFRCKAQKSTFTEREFSEQFKQHEFKTDPFIQVTSGCNTVRSVKKGGKFYTLAMLSPFAKFSEGWPLA